MFNTKKNIYTFLSKVYSRLRSEDFMVRLLKSTKLHGRCYRGARWIELNPDGEILSTLVHEMIHDIYPSWTEKKVASSERLVMAQLSHRQMINLMDALVSALKRGIEVKI